MLSNRKNLHLADIFCFVFCKKYIIFAALITTNNKCVDKTIKF